MRAIKYFKYIKNLNFILTKLYELYRYEVRTLISYKKITFFENGLGDSIGKPTELWKGQYNITAIAFEVMF